MKLFPSLFNCLESILHKKHLYAYKRIINILSIENDDRVVEIGCGTGILANHFVSDGYEYLGVDIDYNRIEYAKSNVDGAIFIVGDAINLDYIRLPEVRFFVFRGVLHHLSDDQCHNIISKIFNSYPEACIALCEPISPDIWWKNPLQSILLLFDDGSHIRKITHWHRILSQYLESYSICSGDSRWPIDTIYAKLTYTE